MSFSLISSRLYGWNEERERGSSSLRGDLDTLALLARCKDDRDVIVLRVEKQKDGPQHPELPEIRFKLQRIDVAKDRTACVAVLAGASDVTEPALGENFLLGYQVLCETFPSGTTHTHWLEAMPDSFGSGADARKQKLYRVRRVLLKRGWIEQRKGKLVAVKGIVTRAFE